TDLTVGTAVSGAGIPANTVITAIAANSVTISANATASGTPSLTFTGLTFTPGASPTAAQVQAHLQSITALNAANGNVVVTGNTPGGPFTVTFSGNLTGQNVALLTAASTGGTTAAFQTT